MERAWTLNKEANHYDRQSSTHACPQLPHLVSSDGSSLAGCRAGKLGALFSSFLPPSLPRSSVQSHYSPSAAFLASPQFSSSLLANAEQSKFDVCTWRGREGVPKYYRQCQQDSAHSMMGEGRKQEYRADITCACPSGQSRDDLCV